MSATARQDSQTQPGGWDGKDRRIEHRMRVPSEGAEAQALQYLAGCLERVDDRLDKGSERMDLMQAELSKNTQVTTEVRELLELGRAGFKVLGFLGRATIFLGKATVAIGAIGGAVFAILHWLKTGELPKP